MVVTYPSADDLRDLGEEIHQACYGAVPSRDSRHTGMCSKGRCPSRETQAAPHTLQAVEGK